MSAATSNKIAETLEELLTRISNDQALDKANEEAIRQVVVLPILRHLGWNTENHQEVYPEFPVEGKRVDYCLRYNGHEQILIETKRGGEILGDGNCEEQLLGYAFRVGVPIAALTNGIEWWLYLPLKQGTWKERKFFVIDLAQQEPSSASLHFQGFLGREGVADGSCVRKANEVLNDNVRAHKTSEALPKVWAALWEQPDDLPNEFFEAIRQRVESTCGYPATQEEIVKFLSQIKNGIAPLKLPVKKDHVEPGTDKRSKSDKVKDILQDGEWHSASELRTQLNVTSINPVLNALEQDGVVELRRTTKGNQARLKKE